MDIICTQCGREAEGEATSRCPDCQGAVVGMGSRLDLGPGRVLGKDRYVLMRLLGRGAMGSVFVGKQRALGKIVAIKVMIVDFARNPAALKRFYNEGKNAGRLEHPHNVKVFDFGHEEDDAVFLVMDLVRGQPLARLPIPMPVPRALRISSQICRALGEAHALGLVHRDLKPDNVMITELDGEDFARVLDYGIAKHIHATTTALTRTGMMVGTPRYLSPEQAVGHPVDPRSDLYSLGAMLFELITGRPVFEAPNAVALAVAHVHKPARRPSQILPTVPRRLDDLVFKLLSKKPEDRPENADAVRRELDAILDEVAGRVTPQSQSKTAVAPVVAMAAGNETADGSATAEKGDSLALEMAIALALPPEPSDAPAGAPVERVAALLLDTPVPDAVMSQPGTRFGEAVAPHARPVSGEAATLAASSELLPRIESAPVDIPVPVAVSPAGGALAAEAAPSHVALLPAASPAATADPITPAGFVPAAIETPAPSEPAAIAAAMAPPAPWPSSASWPSGAPAPWTPDPRQSWMPGAGGAAAAPFPSLAHGAAWQARPPTASGGLRKRSLIIAGVFGGVALLSLVALRGDDEPAQPALPESHAVTLGPEPEAVPENPLPAGTLAIVEPVAPMPSRFEDWIVHFFPPVDAAKPPEESSPHPGPVVETPGTATNADTPAEGSAGEPAEREEDRGRGRHDDRDRDDDDRDRDRNRDRDRDDDDDDRDDDRGRGRDRGRGGDNRSEEGPARTGAGNTVEGVVRDIGNELEGIFR